MPEVRHVIRVRYAECDMLGVVFNANYLAYFDMNMTELWRAAIGGYEAMQARGLELVVVHCEIDFQGPARFDEELELSVSVARLGTTSVGTRHRIARAGAILADGSMTHVLVERDGLGTAALPDWIRGGLAPWASA